MSRSFHCAILTVALGGALLTPATAGTRIPLPDGVFYYKPAASVFGPEAAWINPAILSRYSAAGYQLMTDFTHDASFKSWGAVVNHERLALAYRNLYNPGGEDYKEYVFAVAMSLGRLHLGGSYRYFKDGPDTLDNRHFWNVGLAGQGQGPFAWGAVFSNLNRGRVKGERTEIEQRYSLAYRPIGQKATLSVDMLLSTGTKFRNADYVYHLEVSPRTGLFVEGFLTSDGDFQLGLRANLLNYLVGSQSFFSDNGDHRHTTAYVGATSMRQPSLIPPQGRRRLSINLSGTIPENPPRPVFGQRQTSFVEYITTIYRAADDPTISEMALQIKGLALGFGQAQELREA
ncbi:MAG: hypothetical protein AB1744_14210, partial [Candidatus Zixiibacteriota bacterium]